MGQRRPGPQAGVYSLVDRGLNQAQRRDLAERKLREIYQRQKAGLPDEGLQIDPNEYERIFSALLKEGKKTLIQIPGRPDLSALTQEDYWEAVRRGI